MSILIDEKTLIVMQGITGDKGTFHTKEMIGYGSNVVGGVTPGKGGTTHLGLPDFDTMKEAVKASDDQHHLRSARFRSGRDHGSRGCRTPRCAD